MKGLEQLGVDMQSEPPGRVLARGFSVFAYFGLLLRAGQNTGRRALSQDRHVMLYKGSWLFLLISKYLKVNKCRKVSLRGSGAGEGWARAL